MALSAPHEPDARRLQVLVAHGHAIVREGTRRILETEPGFDVVAETVSLAEALPLLELLRPDVLVIGIDPTEVETRAYVQKLRSAQQLTHVLALDPGVPLQRLPSLGLSGWLSSMASPAELIAGVRAVVEGRDPSSAASEPAAGKPTPRELEVLTLIERGLTTRAIAERLQTTPRTVHFHVGNLFSKLGARSRTEMVHLARQLGWLD